MHHNPLISVIIPNYNHALFLKQRIDTVLNQTFQDFEVIILDDCSTDSSREIIEQYRGHSKISNIIFNDKNSGGVFKQWIKGIEIAKGDYVWIAESDDYASANFLEETLKIIENDLSLGMVFTNTNSVNREGKFITTTAESKAAIYVELTTHKNIINKENASLFLISEMIIENASSVLFRKSSLLSVNFSELEKFFNTGDRFVYIGIALNASVYFLSKPLNFMRLHQNNTTKKSYENGNIHKDRLRVLNYYFDQLYGSVKNRKIPVLFYKNNYLNFITHGNYDDNISYLNKLKKNNEVESTFYYLVKFYLYLFRKAEIKSKILRSIYYRTLVVQNHFNKDYQK